jgi:hypothetical protein
MRTTNIILIIMTILAVRIYAQEQQKSKTSDQEPSVTLAMDLKNYIVIPLKALIKKNENPFVYELETISEDLFKLVYHKIVSKHEAFIQASKSFDEGLLASDAKYAYLESWLALTDKRIRKVDDYKNRLAKIQERLGSFDKKLDTLKKTDPALWDELSKYSSNIKAKIGMASNWLEKSKTSFSNILKMLQERETAFKKAGVPKI